MANHKSALKRMRQDAKKNILNRSRKTRLKNVVKDVEAALTRNASPEDASNLFRKAQQVIDKVAATGTIHRRTAARRISRLGKRVAKFLSGRS